MFKKIRKVIIIALCILQLAVSSYFIGNWFKSMLHTYFIYFDTPKDNRIFTTSLSEYFFSMYIRNNLPQDAHIFWVPQASYMVNYYIYPRKIYHVKDFLPDEKIELEGGFLSAKKISYIFFDYDKFYPIENVEIARNKDKAVILGVKKRGF